MSQIAAISAVGVLIFFNAVGVVAAAADSPQFESLGVEQLHKTYEDVPHRYALTIQFTGGVSPIAYRWSINCGSFTTTTNAPRVEWQYQTPGECGQAVVLLAVTDSSGRGQLLSQTVFEPSTREVKDVVTKDRPTSPTPAADETVSTASASTAAASPATETRTTSSKKNIAYGLFALFAVGVAGSYAATKRSRKVSEMCARIKAAIEELEKQLSDTVAEQESVKNAISTMEHELKDLDKKNNSQLTQSRKEAQDNHKHAVNFLESINSSVTELEAKVKHIRAELKKWYSSKRHEQLKDLEEDLGRQRGLVGPYTQKLTDSKSALQELERITAANDVSIGNRKHAVADRQKEMGALEKRRGEIALEIEKMKRDYQACLKQKCLDGEDQLKKSTRSFTLADADDKARYSLEEGPIKSNYISDKDAEDMAKFFHGMTMVLGRLKGNYAAQLPKLYLQALFGAAAQMTELAIKIRKGRAVVFESMTIEFPVEKRIITYETLYICKDNAFHEKNDARFISERKEKSVERFVFPPHQDYIFGAEFEHYFKVLQQQPEQYAKNKKEYDAFVARLVGYKAREF